MFTGGSVGPVYRSGMFLFCSLSDIKRQTLTKDGRNSPPNDGKTMFGKTIETNVGTGPSIV